MNATTQSSGRSVLARLYAQANPVRLGIYPDHHAVGLINTATPNNYRLFEISPGAPAGTGTADGTKLFVGLNAGGGLQAYVNNVNGNSVSTDIATANTWNNGGTLGAYTANKWYFMALTYDVTGGTSQLYSGDQTSSATLSAALATLPGVSLDI